MHIEIADEGKRILSDAEEKARERKEPLTTLHLLLALCDEQAMAANILRAHGVTQEWIRTCLKVGAEEPFTIFQKLNYEVQRLARSIESIKQGTPQKIRDLHLLAGLLTLGDSLACRNLDAAGLSPAQIRGSVLGCLTGTGRRVASCTGPLAPPGPRGAPPPAPAGGPPLPGTVPPIPPRGITTSIPPRPAAPGPQMKLPIPSIHQRIARYGESKQRAARAAARPFPGAAREAAPPRRSPPPEWVLDERQFPVLQKLCTNLNLRAWGGELDELLGRETEIECLMDILGRRRGNNPILIGETGVGKTAIVEGLAQRIVRGDITGAFRGKLLLAVVPSSLFGGTSLRGSLSEKIATVKKEAEGLQGRLVLFFDDATDMLKGMENGGEGILHELRETLCQGLLPSVFTATPQSWKKILEMDGGFAHCLTPVFVEEVTREQSAGILRRLSGRYAAHHGVVIDEEACDAAVNLATRYIAGRRNPEKALMLMDLAAARAGRTGERRVTPLAVAQVVASLADVKVERLAETDGERLLGMEAELRRLIVGHDEAVGRVAAAIRRNAAGFRGRRPIGSFLFLGPTGVGKTEMAKAMARVIFGKENAILRFDMSEFAEAHATARLIGAPPGYVGFEKGGELTDAIAEHSYRLVLFDEFEKAHQSVHRLLLQILEEGRLTDAHGRTVSFHNSIVVLTSNVGSDLRPQGRTGFCASGEGARGDYRRRMRERSIETFSPELVNRIDEVIVFSPLSVEEVREVAARMLARSAETIMENRGIKVAWEPAVVDFLIDAGGFDPALGARPMRRTIQATIEALVADLIIAGKAREGASIRLQAGGESGLAARVRNRGEKAPRGGDEAQGARARRAPKAEGSGRAVGFD